MAMMIAEPQLEPNSRSNVHVKRQACGEMVGLLSL